MAKLKIVTFNLRNVYDKDGINSFVHRQGLILDKISGENPDIICFQEVTDIIRAFLKNNLKDYLLLGCGRNADFQGEGLSFAIKKDCFEVVSFEQTWLSPTPFVAGSRFQNQSMCPRILPIIALKHRDAKTPIRLFGIHLDHRSDEARVLGMNAVLEKVVFGNQNLPLPTVILGDFNARPDSAVIERINNFSEYKLVDVTKEIPLTFHAFGTRFDEQLKIDYIYVDENSAKSVSSVNVWDDVKNGIYLSDHYPIEMTLNIE